MFCSCFFRGVFPKKIDFFTSTGFLCPREGVPGRCISCRCPCTAVRVPFRRIRRRREPRPACGGCKSSRTRTKSMGKVVVLKKKSKIEGCSVNSREWGFFEFLLLYKIYLSIVIVVALLGQENGVINFSRASCDYDDRRGCLQAHDGTRVETIVIDGRGVHRQATQHEWFYVAEKLISSFTRYRSTPGSSSKRPSGAISLRIYCISHRILVNWNSIITWYQNGTGTVGLVFP